MMNDFWYSACASSRLLPGRPFATRVLSTPIVLFRTAQGELGALRDRCPHRGLPLSAGKLKGDKIQCGFHGWEFSAEGRCCHVPSLDSSVKIPEVFNLESFTCVERDGFIWIWMGKQPADPSKIPLIDRYGERSWIQGSLTMACDFVKAIEINVDGAHVYFVHPKHPATQSLALRQGTTPPVNELRMVPDGFVTFWPATGEPTDPIPPTSETITFRLPNRVTIRSSQAGHDLSVELFFVATGERQCRMDYLVSQPHGAGHSVRWMDAVPEIFAEDKAVLEAVEKATAGDENFVEKNVPADTATRLARKMIESLKDGSWSELSPTLPQRVVFKGLNVMS